MFSFFRSDEAGKNPVVTGSKQSSVDNLNTVRCEASRHCRNKIKGYLKAKIDELETNSKIENIRDL